MYTADIYNSISKNSQSRAEFRFSVILFLPDSAIFQISAHISRNLQRCISCLGISSDLMQFINATHMHFLTPLVPSPSDMRFVFFIFYSAERYILINFLMSDEDKALLKQSFSFNQNIELLFHSFIVCIFQIILQVA